MTFKQGPDVDEGVHDTDTSGKITPGYKVSKENKQVHRAEMHCVIKKEQLSLNKATEEIKDGHQMPD